MLDHEEDWIEKYRAALAQVPPSRRVRIATAFNSLARALGFAIGKTSAKLQSPVPSSIASGPLPDRGVHQPLDPGIRQREDDASNTPLDRRQDKKAS